MLLHEFIYCITCKLVAEFNYEVIGLSAVGPELFTYCTFKAYYSGELKKNTDGTQQCPHDTIKL